MKKLVFGAIIIGFASLGYSQISDCDCGKNTIHLTGVEVSPVDHNYLNNVGGGAVSLKVLDLQNQASRYNIQKSKVYDFNSDKRKTYVVSFKGENGRILATYNQSGKIIRASEYYSDLILPPAVRNAAFKEHPDWTLYGTKYSVNFDGKNAKKKYQLQMKKNNEKENLNYNTDGRRLN
ncbi:hypothetical protein DHD05_05955 [Arenibacter sp. N53]|uniref:hypothetical protein n=1 Tax=Arenibacter TaxID=178469 RepID=UPI000CD3FA5C|nr:MULTISPECIES: hypothetical protein [Arenibacter]MCM4151130.1 hypothetical protein [Arenibacter sp. N53]